MDHIGSIIVLLSLISLPFASGFSSGSGMPCDLNLLYGCTTWTNGDRLQCSDGNPGAMKWVARPVVSDAYSIRSSDEDPSGVSRSFLSQETESAH